MFAISPTDYDWFNNLKDSGSNSYVNFWTPTPWNIKKLSKGNKLYFMLKSPYRKIGGFGEFVEYKNLTALEAWNEFGYRNGRKSRDEFIKSIQDYIDKNSTKFGKNIININTYEIGCIVLNNCEYWDEENFIDPNKHEVDFATQVVKIKYFNQYDSFVRIQSELDNFNFVNEPRDERKRQVNVREGQGKFKGKILKAYNNKCCISGEIIPELLEAAHIQEYRNKNSNHVQNGLLLRIDLHRLYDNGLIYIDENYIIHISRFVTNPFYKQYDGKIIDLPNSQENQPSREALKMRSNIFRN